jgi:AcrR family transcriptional regulator
MPRSTGVRDSQAAATRDALVKAARQLFATHGFHETGTTAVAALAGVTRGALQHHFPSKEDLFLAVFTQIEEEIVDFSLPADETRVGERWRILVDKIFAFLQAAVTQEVQQIILIDGPSVLGWAEWRRLEAHYGLGIIERAVIDGMNAGQIRPQSSKLLAHLILAVINEAGLIIAHAEDSGKARAEAQYAVQTLLQHLG